MKEFFNSIRIAGKLVSHTLEEATYIKDTNEVECIRGEVVIRTADDSEHSVRMFSDKYKKNTTELSKIYKSLVTVMNEYVTMENSDEGYDYVEITGGSFGVNDYLSKKEEGKIVTINTIKSNFINRIPADKIDVTEMTAKFEVEGVIAEIKDEIVKNEPTGSLIVTMNVINQTVDGKGKDRKVTGVVSMFPLKLSVAPDLVNDFREIYCEGNFAKVTGTIINKAEVIESEEKQALGGSIKKTFTNYVNRNEIATGSAPQSIYEVELTDDICNQLISRRKAHLAEVKTGKNKSNSTSEEAASAANTGNPFATKTAKNPFVK